jgi:AraC-like DNA-binding protein
MRSGTFVERLAPLPGMQGSYAVIAKFTGPLAEPVAWPGYGLWLLYAGANDVWHERRSYSVGGNRVMMLRPGDVMRATRRFGPRTSDVAFVFTADAYTDASELRRGRRTSFRDPNPSDIGLVERARAAVRAAMSGTTLEAGVALQSLIERMHGYDGHESSAKSRSPSPRLVRARDFIEANYAKHVALDDLVAETGLNKAYIVSGFHRAFGVPPHRYQNLLRISRATDMLRTGMRIVDVAIATGHADHSHFTRQFRRLMGVSPSHWQQVVLPGHRARRERTPR